MFNSNTQHFTAARERSATKNRKFKLEIEDGENERHWTNKAIIHHMELRKSFLQHENNLLLHSQHSHWIRFFFLCMYISLRGWNGWNWLLFEIPASSAVVHSSPQHPFDLVVFFFILNSDTQHEWVYHLSSSLHHPAKWRYKKRVNFFPISQSKKWKS